MVCIYKITNLLTGDFYIGQTIDFENRIKAHKRVPPPKMRDDVKKYGWDNFKFEVVEECNRGELKDRECYYIKTLNPAYNILPFGYEVTEETRRKRSQTLMGHEVKPETRAKLRKFQLGRKHTKASREKMSRSRKGHPVSPEVREKIRQAHLGRKHNYKTCEKSLVCVETQVIYESIKAAALALGVSKSTISSALRGRVKTVHGMHIKYTEESAAKIPSPKLSESAVNKKPVICIDTGQVFESIIAASRFLDISYSSVNAVLNGFNVFAGGHLFRFVDESLNGKIRSPESIKCFPAKRVLCVETGEIFSNIKAVAKKFSVKPYVILVAIKTKTKAIGFSWEFTEAELPIKKSAITSKAKMKSAPKKVTVSVICVETGQTFSSVNAAADYIKQCSSSISNALNKSWRTAGGYHWIHADERQMITKAKKTVNYFKKSVVCVETGERFSSVKEAGEKFGVYPASISSVLSGRRETVKGFHFRYLNKGGD